MYHDLSLDQNMPMRDQVTNTRAFQYLLSDTLDYIKTKKYGSSTDSSVMLPCHFSRTNVLSAFFSYVDVIQYK